VAAFSADCPCKAAPKDESNSYKISALKHADLFLVGQAGRRVRRFHRIASLRFHGSCGSGLFRSSCSLWSSVLRFDCNRAGFSLNGHCPNAGRSAGA
jgi:hypothetical protein